MFFRMIVQTLRFLLGCSLPNYFRLTPFGGWNLGFSFGFGAVVRSSNDKDRQSGRIGQQPSSSSKRYVCELNS